jgi:hypothetical protein
MQDEKRQTTTISPPRTSAGFEAGVSPATGAVEVPLFPCRNKRPLTANGFKAATTDLAQLARWEAEFPGCQWGMPTGTASGLVVLDVDQHGEVDGAASLRDLEAKHAPLPATYEVCTPSCGLHLYFRYRGDDLRNSAGKLGPGLDVRAGGGYVIVPRGEGCRYSVLQDVEPAPLPGWLLALLRSPATPTPAPATPAPEDTIPEGKRNDTLARLAGTLHARGFTTEAVEAALLAQNAARCTPPLPDAEVRAIAANITKRPRTAAGSTVMVGTAECLRSKLWDISRDDTPATIKPRLIGEAVVEWLHMRGRFYHVEDRREFGGVYFFDADRKLLLPVQGDAFLAWLSDSMHVNRVERAFSFAASAVETEGLSARSTAITPSTFWASRPGAIYISCAPGSMVRITAAGVDQVDNGTDGVLFPYGATLAPWTLADPVDPFGACSIFNGMQTAAPHGKHLVRLWTAALPADLTCKPPLCLTSDVGGGKTATVRGVFRLLGMGEAINAVAKNGEGDFWATLDGGGLTCFDNCDTRVEWLPDALAAAATAGTHMKRRLYTDADRVLLRARAAIVLTSANPTFAADAGLADRLIVVRLNRRTGETAESALFDEVDAARDRGLSWIAHTLRAALADEAPTPTRLNARHPDFAALAVRIGRACGMEAETIAALRTAEADKSLFNVENDNVGSALIEIASAGPFGGSASDVLARLVEHDQSFEGRMSVNRLGKRLAKLWPHLAAALQATQDRDGHTRTLRYWFNPPQVCGVCGV